jgi:hypothetical protein
VYSIMAISTVGYHTVLNSQPSYGSPILYKNISNLDRLVVLIKAFA